jgi:membrane-associated phospholipid phosphatase
LSIPPPCLQPHTSARSRLWRFIEARLSPAGELGLHLTAGVLALVVTTWLFGVLAAQVTGQRAITVLDLRIANWFHAHAFEPLTALMRGVSLVHTGYGIAPATALLAWRWRRLGAHYWSMALLACVAGGALLNVLLKYAYQRSRPVFNEPLVSLLTYSFPSGHAAAATVLYGVVACRAVMVLPGRGARVLAVSGCIAMVMLVATSRVYLGAHYLSDVLGGMLESCAWLAVCITSFSTLRRRREGRAMVA